MFTSVQDDGSTPKEWKGPTKKKGPENEVASPPALILFDSTGPYGYLGELYAMGTANLVSHFGGWTAKRATTYVCGEAQKFSAILYFGSTYDEPLPTCLLDDVLLTNKPVIWGGFNIWQLTARAGDSAFIARYGWRWQGLDFSQVAQVRYKGQDLVRYAGNASGVMQSLISDAQKVTVLAQAVRADGSTFPWALRSGNLTYLSEIPFTYMSEEDRVLIFADLLFDALAPSTPERHRALVRLEDINPSTDPDSLRAIADYLCSRNVPFGFGVIPEYVDPLGYYNEGTPVHLTLKSSPELVSAIQYLLSHGGVMVMHGRTHQWEDELNPYTGVTADDTEFFRVTHNEDYSINFLGPLPKDSRGWAKDRIHKGQELFSKAKLPAPKIFEFPHYTASVNSQRAVAELFDTRWERAIYFGGLLTNTSINSAHMFGQLFPYVVQDLYDTTVLPENLGNIEPDQFYSYPRRLPEDIIRAARKNRVVRDGFASFYFHPFFDIQLLQQTVEGIQAEGFTFVSPNELIP
ncbi:DUF2334 domain-containing protein [Hyalangium versicolor]|uniref:DUF2334 domain-containing protein n=1 Tax=Hyalangium versicolor TaxID=2861190 RepID=UPI001CCE765A|nr:polysaccharide deacetylase family protein [Hyalangium versicolor]